MESSQADHGWRIRIRDNKRRWDRLHRKLPRTGCLRTLGLAGLYGLVMLHCLGVATATFMVQMLAFVTILHEGDGETHSEGNSFLIGLVIGTGCLIAGGLTLSGVRLYRGIRIRVIDLDSLAMFVGSVVALLLFVVFTYVHYT